MTIPETARPHLSPGVKLQFDRTREQWILQAPERVFVLDDTAYEIVLRCTGEVSLQALVRDLSNAFDADEVEIAGDVEALLESLIEKRVVVI
ncbi:MAG TPA: pyrroloquinoline quinone biosynthesis peptide chaperone PqqD [Terriglobia bacterium]|nr:pyrroloquinoline quinone biosynthesis peptide chaperone PqqD [Terriglobia bacterium]